MKKTLSIRLCCVFLLLVTVAAQAQVNSGSNGSDGAFNPTTNTLINMADHPDGIYHYTSVNIPSGVTVTFIPNANNTPVVWLVQSNVVISGTVNVSGQGGIGSQAGQGGPGGFRGGNGGFAGGGGFGPGGGLAEAAIGGGGSFGTAASIWQSPNYVIDPRGGQIYGNQYLLPLIGGSGGGGATNYPGGGGGGGGAIQIASSHSIDLSGVIYSRGGVGAATTFGFGAQAGGGSGGGVRLVSSMLTGGGGIEAGGGGGYGMGGNGRVRIDVLENTFSGGITGHMTQGFQPVIIPTVGQGAQLTVTSVGGVPVSASPTGALSTPDAVLSAQQNNPISIVVRCANIPLNTQITVSVKPVNGPAVSATGFNNTGTLASSTATVSINMPRGGGLIYATAAIGN